MFASTPIGWLTVGLGAVAMAAVWVGTHWQGTKLIFMDVWNAIVKVTQSGVNIAIDLANGYLQYYKFVFDAIKYAGVSIWDGIVKAAQAGINAVLRFLAPVAGILKRVGINIPTSVNFSGAIGTVQRPQWDPSFGFHHLSLTGGLFSPKDISTQRAKATGDLTTALQQHKLSLDANTKAIQQHLAATNANTTAMAANTNATNAKTAKSNMNPMSAESIADTLMPRLERHLYGT